VFRFVLILFFIFYGLGIIGALTTLVKAEDVAKRKFAALNLVLIILQIIGTCYIAAN
jgi:hypothetical protein